MKGLVTEIIEREMYEIDYLLILHVKSLREERSWTQQELSTKMGLAKSFVGNVENLTERHKYSIRHIALLVKAFGYDSLGDLFSFDAPTHDKVTLSIEVTKSFNEKSGKSRISKTELKDIVLSIPLR